MSNAIGIGLIGMGTVGSGVARLLQDAPSSMRRRKHDDFALKRVAVRDASKRRPVDLGNSVLTTDAAALVRDPSVQMVVEVSGAAEAYEWISSALKNGKDVVTANKAVLATHGEELFALALEHGADLMFEASVAAGIPIIRSLRSGLVANKVESLYGILNGTTNYIMTQMTRGAGTYEQILRQAQEKGYAEPDPTMDVSGADAAQKLALLCRIAFHATCKVEDIFCEGIERIEPRDIDLAGELGYTIKLLAIAKHNGGSVQARVHPAMVPSESLLANIHDEYNAIEVVGSAVGTQVFYGKGAGQMPTASAVVSDMVELAERKRTGAGSAVGDMILGDEATCLADVQDVEIRYYVRLLVRDQPGVLEKIAHIFAHEGISIASLIQKERDLKGGTVPLIITTQEATELAMQRSIEELGRLDVIEDRVHLIRMEEL